VPERHYLAGLDLAGRRVVVVGAGTVAQRRLPRLLAAGAEVEVVAPSATPAVEGMAAAGELRWSRRPYAEGDLEGAWYALACTSSPSVNAAVCAEAERLRVFCVRADRGIAGTAVTPATTEHDGLLIGVLSGGQPRRSAAVRDALLEALRTGLVPDPPAVAEPPAGAGPAAGPDPAVAQPAAGAGSAVAQPAAGSRAAALPGVALVGGGPGDPDLITVRGRRLLARADVVVADRLAPRELLDELAPHVEVVDAAKLPHGRAASQDAINEVLVSRALDGKFVVRLKGGDPFVFGRGYEEVLACARAGVPVTVVPGVSSAFGVPSAAGVPVTHRGVAHEVVVASGHVPPDDPSSLVDWTALARLSGTLVLLMAVEHLASIADALVAGGRPASTPVAVIANGTRPTQRLLRSTLDTVAADMIDAAIRPPAIIIIGHVAGVSAVSYT
jgi:uroporphyrin-III C-methyltransferase / precorrin-2 dehydrogenase / sirohydrochlorin ferrochelatase